MKTKLFDFINRDNLIYNLSGITKLICFFLLTGSVMFIFDIRYIAFVVLFSIFIYKISEIEFDQIRLMLCYVALFLSVNFVLTFIFNPMYGTKIYGTVHELFRFNGRYIVTKEQLLYQLTKLLKYASVVPLGMIFFLTTNPSEFAASLNRIKLNYKAAYTVSLTLRYFPDMLRNYEDISLAQQSRGLDLSKKEKFATRVKNTINILVPLVFSALDKIETASNAMDLRGFGKHKKRTWYVPANIKKIDICSLVLCAIIFIGSVCITVFINKSRFWNPFVI